MEIIGRALDRHKAAYIDNANKMTIYSTIKNIT